MNASIRSSPPRQNAGRECDSLNVFPVLTAALIARFVRKGTLATLHYTFGAMLALATARLAAQQDESVTGNLTIAGTTAVNSTAASNSPTTGALTVAGGAGIQGSLNIGGNLSAAMFTASSGSILGSASGLTLLAGGSNQNITITPSGTGYTLLNGSVGIGTLSPSARLTVKGAGMGTGKGFVIADSSGGENFVVTDNGQITGSNRLSISAPGMAGSASPTISAQNTSTSGTSIVSTLDQVSSAQASLVSYGSGASGNYTFGETGTSQSLIYLVGNNAGVSPRIIGYNGLRFGTGLLSGGSWSEVMRITSGGNVGIGATNPGSKLSILQTSAGAETVPLTVLNTANTPNTAVAINFNVEASGNVPTGKISNVRVGSSDYRTDFYNYTNGLNRAMSLYQNNVGIGTVAPTSNLHVSGNASPTGIQSNTENTNSGGTAATVVTNNVANIAQLQIFGSAVGGTTAGVSQNNLARLITTADNLMIGNIGASSIEFVTNGSERLRIVGSNGNVGIGTTNPTAKLDVAGDAKIGGNLTVGGAFNAPSYTASNGTFAGGASGLALNAGGTNQNITITPSGAGATILNGNVGIGSAVPASKLTIETSSAFNQFTLRNDGYYAGGWARGADMQFRKNGGTYHRGLAYGIYGSGDGLGGAYFSAVEDNPSPWSSAQLFLASSGNVGIGTTNPGSRLSVQHTSAGAETLPITIVNADNTANTAAAIGFNVEVSGTTVTGKISNMRVGSSDYRMDFQNYTGSLGTVMSLYRGNLGVGTIYPRAKLHVFGQNNNDYFTQGSQGLVVGLGGAEGIALWENAVTGASYIGNLYPPGSMHFVMDAKNTSNPVMAMTINSAGNVGIGTSNPGSPLSVEPTSRPTNGWITKMLYSGLTTTGGSNSVGYVLGRDASNYNLASMDFNYLGANSTSNYASFGMYGMATPAIVYTGSGNVGIGTTNPGSKLSILQTSAGAETVPLTLLNTANAANTAVAINFNVEATGNVSTGKISNVRVGLSDYRTDFYNYTNGLNRTMSLYQNNVGVGTTSPSAKLSVTGSGTGTGAAFVVANSSNVPKFLVLDNGSITTTSTFNAGANISMGSAAQVQLDAGTAALPGLSFGGISDNDTGLFRFAPNTLGFTTNGAIKAVIDGGGNVGIGTTAPLAKLDVSGHVNVTGSLEATAEGIFQGGLTLGGSGNQWTLSNTGDTLSFIQSGAARMTVNASGGANFTGSVSVGGGTGIVLTTTGADFNNKRISNVGYATQNDDAASKAYVDGTNPFMWDGPAVYLKPSAGVGLGTNLPAAPLHIARSNGDGEIARFAPASGASTRSYLRLNTGNAQSWWEFSVQDASGGGTTNGLAFRARDGNGNSQTRLYLAPDGHVGVGTTSPDEALTVNGTVHAKEVVVDTAIAAAELKVRPRAWADHVFEEDYRNAPLSEVEDHIKEHKRLPGVPSAQDVAEQGVNLGQMQATLLQKIEELTLHLIEQEKRIKRLESENTALRATSN